MLLLLDSVLFYYLLFCGRKCMALLALTIFVSWLWGILLKKSEALSKKIRKLLLVGGVAACACPLILMDISKMATSIMRREIFENIVIPVGLSFYTLQIIAYLIDIYRERINPQKNIFKYALFVSFFPQIIQGPISRYEDLSNQLIEGSVFNPNNIQRGFQLILWGFFLKYMIADKAGIIVNTIYGDLDAYSGIYFFVAGTLYTLQLYTDFLSCTTLSRGAALLFGIKLVDNFNQPFFAGSIRDFWKRWHISLSSWLRDYVYIPLGGNRKGMIRKWCNLMLTFLVSGIWHGGTLKFIFWGLMHSIYQIVGELTFHIRDRIWQVSGVRSLRLKRAFRITGTSFLFMISMIIFRADTLTIGLWMIRSMFVEFNPWILSGRYMYNLGLSQNEWSVLLCSVFILFAVSLCHEKNILSANT